MARVLVTGGSGFLGSHVVDALAEHPDTTPVVFDRAPSPYASDGVDQVGGDLLDIESLDSAVQDCEVVYHLAALADLNQAKDRPVETVLNNVLGTVNLLEAARKHGVSRFMFASTVYVYSREGGFYRCSKQACEAYIEEYQRHYGLTYTVLRFGSLYGPRSGPSNGLYRLLQQAAKGERIAYFGSPDDTREYIHVEDAARLSVEAMADEYANQHLILTGHDRWRAHDLMTMFSEILGKPVDVDYRTPTDADVGGHYRVTPYAFHPKAGRKLTSTCYVDMGQGILHVCEQIFRDAELSTSECLMADGKPEDA